MDTSNSVSNYTVDVSATAAIMVNDAFEFTYYAMGS